MMRETAGGECLYVHGFVPGSRSNGPGLRVVLWVQGCPLGCPGCFNPASHAQRPPGSKWPVARVAAELSAALRSADGLTISGGEPFEQAPALAMLLAALRRDRGDFSVICFTGYDWEELPARPGAAALLPFLDVVIAGRYVAALRLARGLLGSANKRVHLLTGRHGPAEFVDLPEAEALIHPDGRVTITGIDPPLLTLEP